MEAPMRRSVLMAMILSVAACRGKVTDHAKGSPESQIVLAQVDDIVITSADLKETLARYNSQPFVLARYSSLERKKELLDNLIRFQVMVVEARKRGYDRDPEVLRVAKEKMVKQLTQQEINDKIKPSDVPDADVEKYYKDHTGDYVRPETVRASQILVRDRAKASKVHAEAKALPKADAKAFRELVAKYTEDEDSKQRGGDLMHFDRSSALYPAPLVKAAFALKETGDVSEVIATDKGFVVLRLTERRAGISRSLEEAKPEIQRRLVEELRNKKRKELVEEARKGLRVEVFEDQLAKLDLTAGATGPSHAGMSSPLPLRAVLDAGVVLGNRP
jgi:peptidyl-prolyl cis-trans isomerase C